MPRSVSARALAGAATLLILAGCGSTAVAPSAAPESAVAPSAASTAATASAKPAASIAASTAPGVYDTRALGRLFDLPLTMRLPEGWLPLTPPQYGPAGTVGAVQGEPDDDSTWWGFGFLLVDGASVLDPADIANPKGNTKQPWPASFLDYMIALPGVKVVDGPAAVTLGGMSGREVTVMTPAMHPTIFLKGDTMWIGGGKSGIDPAFERKLIEVTVRGKHLLMEYDDLPELFDEHVKLVDPILATVAFPD